MAAAVLAIPAIVAHALTLRLATGLLTLTLRVLSPGLTRLALLPLSLLTLLPLSLLPLLSLSLLALLTLSLLPLLALSLLAPLPGLSLLSRPLTLLAILLALLPILLALLAAALRLLALLPGGRVLALLPLRARALLS